MRLICGALVGHAVYTRAAWEAGRGTHAVGKVCNQVGDLDTTGLEFTVEPAYGVQQAFPLTAVA